jgi:hypothetical protein
MCNVKLYTLLFKMLSKVIMFNYFHIDHLINISKILWNNNIIIIISHRKNNLLICNFETTFNFLFAICSLSDEKFRWKVCKNLYIKNHWIKYINSTNWKIFIYSKIIKKETNHLFNLAFGHRGNIILYYNFYFLFWSLTAGTTKQKA